MNEFKRGDIVFVENPIQDPHGHIVSGNHPAVIIQNQTGNEFSGTLIIAYLSSKLKKLNQPTHVVLQWYPGLKKVSVLQAEQLATINKDDVFSVVGHLKEEDMKRVDMAVLTSLGLREVS